MEALLVPGYELEPDASPIAAEAIGGAIYALIYDQVKARRRREPAGDRAAGHLHHPGSVPRRRGGLHRSPTATVAVAEAGLSSSLALPRPSTGVPCFGDGAERRAGIKGVGEGAASGGADDWT